MRINLVRVAGALSEKMAAMVRKVSHTWMNKESDETRKALIAHWINAPEGVEIPLPPKKEMPKAAKEEYLTALPTV